MSMSFFMEDESKPAVLRGPMMSSTFDKLMFGTDWGKLDVLIVDMPPGLFSLSFDPVILAGLALVSVKSL
jgi:ATP-binding protein involved in chromosome partitioning